MLANRHKIRRAEKPENLRGKPVLMRGPMTFFAGQITRRPSFGPNILARLFFSYRKRSFHGAGTVLARYGVRDEIKHANETEKDVEAHFEDPDRVGAVEKTGKVCQKKDRLAFVRGNSR